MMNLALRNLNFNTALFRRLLKLDTVGFWRFPASGRCRGRKHRDWSTQRTGGAYQRHQSNGERLRRLWQVHRGQLSGKCGPMLRSDYVTTEARMMAAGIVPPDAPRILRLGLS